MNRIAMLFAAAIFAVVSGAAVAGDMSAADLKAMHDYTLSMDKIKAVQGAIDDMKQLAKTDPAFAKLANSDNDDAKNFSEMEARFNANPKLVAILKRHGLRASDMVLAPIVLMSAGVAAAYPSAAAKLADQTSPAQIAFFKQHQKELKSVSWGQ
jgi:hypothetical protein